MIRILFLILTLFALPAAADCRGGFVIDQHSEAQQRAGLGEDIRQVTEWWPFSRS